MSGLDKTVIDFSVSGQASSGVIALGATAVPAALPAQTELLLLTCTGNAHFRAGLTTSSPVAVATDPMVTAGICLVVKLDPSLAYTLSVIQDASSTGNLSWVRVMEG